LSPTRALADVSDGEHSSTAWKVFQEIGGAFRF
jgi:hypothetical protein